jgi:dihydroorotate dehydrogenase electron transfer subunit
MKTIRDLEILSKTFLNKDHFILEVKDRQTLPEILPGQFAEVQVGPHAEVLLRRPLSIHDVDVKKNTLRFMIKIVGKGTRELSMLEVGDTLNVVFPLGTGFDLNTSGPVLLVGGGCGSAPLLFLARILKQRGIQQKILLGARSSNDLMELDEFAEFGDVLLSTDDGSRGEKGFLSNHSIWDKASGFKKVYCCGPELMMKAIAGICSQKGLDCQVSLENTMACGIGACLCCVTETHRGNVCVCTEGPVFNINELKWQI